MAWWGSSPFPLPEDFFDKYRTEPISEEESQRLVALGRSWVPGFFDIVEADPTGLALVKDADGVRIYRLPGAEGLATFRATARFRCNMDAVRPFTIMARGRFPLVPRAPHPASARSAPPTPRILAQTLAST